MTLLTFILTAGTAAYPRWIELVFGIDPDHGNGTRETLIVLACVLVAVTQAARLSADPPGRRAVANRGELTVRWSFGY